LFLCRLIDSSFSASVALRTALYKSEYYYYYYYYVVVINFLWLLQPNQKMPYLSRYQPVPNSATFRENIEILRKQANFGAWLKNPLSVENCIP